ncbi:MAG TPA: NAD(P)-dependent oxidoreductase [Parachlamydiaceae bacterium]|nr:NAD(P)-dependent oxidoreductase [Parachlamydiaceae bacterium]
MSEWKNKRVFISGGSGVIGTALVDNLIKQGAILFVGDLKARPASTSWKEVKYREGDLISLSRIEIEEFNPEVFFHLAATFERSIETKEFWEENYHHNIALSHHLLSLQKDLPALKKIIFASSYLIYNPDKYLFSAPQNSSKALNENDPVDPRNLCGMAKMLHEQELFFINKFRPDLQVVNARIFRSYGKNSRDIISRWIRALLNNESINVYCPEGRFDFVFAEDVALALQSLAESDFKGVVNIGTGRSRSISEVLEILKGHFGSMECQTENTLVPYEASQADMALFNYRVKDFRFRSLEEVIPLLIAYEK